MARISPKEAKALDKGIHMMTFKELQERFQVDFTKGLSSTRVKELLNENAKCENKASYSGIAKAIAENLLDLFSILLMIAFIINVLLYIIDDRNSFNAKYLIDFLVIFVCFVVMSILIGIQEYKSIKLVRRLQSKNMTWMSVLRDGSWTKVPAYKLVVGDVIELGVNERVPVDLRLFIAKNLQFDKSFLTGNLDRSLKKFLLISIKSSNEKQKLIQ